MAVEARRSLTKMPDLEGIPLEKAKLMIRNAGLSLDAVLYREAYESRNTVLEQKPKRGQMVYLGDKVTLHIARRGYIQFLPALYRRSDPSGRNFVRDVLFIIEHLMSPVDDCCDQLERFFDPRECPEEFVEWLASWSAMVLDMDWPIEKKRAIVGKAVELYSIRGTVKGLKIFLSLFTGYEPTVIENQWPFRGFRIGEGLCAIGVDSVVLPPVNLKSCFIVEIPAKFQDVTIETVIRVHDIIQAGKPSHTSYYLRFLAEGAGSELREYFTIGMRSGIGIGMEVVESDIEPVESALPGERTRISAPPEPEPRRVREPPPEPKAEEAPKPGEEKKKFVEAPTTVGIDQEQIARARLAARKKELAEKAAAKAAKDAEKSKDDKKDSKDPKDGK
jgi:phage tail-like protein